LTPPKFKILENTLQCRQNDVSVTLRIVLCFAFLSRGFLVTPTFCNYFYRVAQK